MDTRDCTPCSCAPPWGSKCEGSISIFPNGACQAPPVVADLLISSAAGSQCTFVIPGVSLGSKSATVPVYMPGGSTCTAVGGAATGAVFGSDPVTFCCASTPSPPPVQ